MVNVANLCLFLSLGTTFLVDTTRKTVILGVPKKRHAHLCLSLRSGRPDEPELVVALREGPGGRHVTGRGWRTPRGKKEEP